MNLAPYMTIQKVICELETRSGRSAREGIVYPLHYSWTSLVAQMVKNPPAMRETWIRSVGWKIPWIKKWQHTAVFLPGESPWTEESGGMQSMGSQSQTRISD